MGEDGQRLTVEVEFPDRTCRSSSGKSGLAACRSICSTRMSRPTRPTDRTLTARLYWADLDRRIRQEVLLGVGGVRALRAAWLQSLGLAHE